MSVTKPAFTVEQVRTFLAVAEHEHVSRAAASLHLTQGAVTQQIHNFERAVGVRLLERDGRGVRLTDAGRALAIACRAALRAFEMVEDSARALRQLEAGSLHIGASPTCATHYLPDALATFTQRYPRLTLRVTVEPSSEIANQVRAGALDCGLIEGTSLPELVSVVIAHDALVLVVNASHPLAEMKRVTPAHLSRHRYLGRGREWAAESTVRSMIGDAFENSEVMNLGHPEYVRASAIAGLGYAALSRLAVRNDIDAGVLKMLPIPPVERPILAVRRAAQGGPTLEAFWNHLVDGDKKSPS